MTRKIETENSPSAKYGQEARQLWASGFFFNRNMWTAVGTDEYFLIYIKQQKSCLSGKYDEYVDGVGRCLLVYVRREDRDGVSINPEFSAVPMTDGEYAILYTSGELSVLKENGFNIKSEHEAKAWFYKQVGKYGSKFAETMLKNTLGYQGSIKLSEVPPEKVRDWAVSNGLANTLPNIYRMARHNETD